MTNIELTDQQRQALRTQQGVLTDFVDATTQEHYVLLAQEQYERVRALLEKPIEPASGVPAGVLRSQQAFWRDLPDLLKVKANLGKWICYHRDERIGIAKQDVPLIQECIRRSIPRDEYDLFVIEPLSIPPWEPEEVDPLPPWHLTNFRQSP